MWKKIKAALQRLWEKVRAFWDKHVSSLGQIKKALESMKQRVGESSGKLKDKAYIEEAPAGLDDALGFEGDISVKSIETVINTHKDLLETSEEVVNTTAAFNNTATTKIDDPVAAIKALSSVKDAKTGKLVVVS